MKINWGWYTAYALTIVINSIICYVNDFTILTWQYWVYACMIILSFVAGASYKKE